MCPQPYQLMLRLQILLIRHSDPQNDFTEISQVEQVMALRRCRQQLLHDLFIYFQGAIDQFISGLNYFGVSVCSEPVVDEEPVQN